MFGSKSNKKEKKRNIKENNFFMFCLVLIEKKYENIQI